jgi:hypothetical protein
VCHDSLCRYTAGDRPWFVVPQHFHQVAEVPVHRLRLELVYLEDRSEHHGCRSHVLPRVEEVLHAIAAFSDLVACLPCLGLFSFKASLLNVIVKLVKRLDECVELLLLLSKGVFAGEDAHLTLVLVFLLLDGGSQVRPFIVASWWHGHEAVSFLHLIEVQNGLHRGTT